MRIALTLLFIFIGFAITAQITTPAGDYYLKWECESHQIEYKLSLNTDGTYDLNTYTKERPNTSEVLHNYEKGTWRTKDSVLTFSSKGKKGFDEEYTANLNGSVARFRPKSASGEGAEKNAYVLIFDTSKIFCIEGLEFTKMQ